MFLTFPKSPTNPCLVSNYQKHYLSVTFLNQLSHEDLQRQFQIPYDSNPTNPPHPSSPKLNPHESTQSQ